jgi:hypothetical protein
MAKVVLDANVLIGHLDQYDSLHSRAALRASCAQSRGLQEAKGIVSLGGNADEDCKALYNGDDVK